MKTLWAKLTKPKTRPGIYVTYDELPGLVAKVIIGGLSSLVGGTTREPVDRRPDSEKNKRKYTVRSRIPGHTHRGCCGKKCYGDTNTHSKKEKRGPGRPRKEK